MPSFKLDTATITFAVLIISSTFGAVNHFATASEVDNLRSVTKMSFQELRLEQVQEKRNQYLAIPQPVRQEWQDMEIKRLDDSADRLTRQIEMEAASQQPSGWFD